MTPDGVKAAYRRGMDAAGEVVTFRRYSGAGANRSFFEAEVRARVVDYQPKELVGSIQQGDRRVILLAEDMIAAQVPLDIRKGDKIIVRGKELNVESPNDNTRRIRGVLIAYELQVRGAG